VISTDPDTAKQDGEVMQQRLMRKQVVTPKVEASLCVENSRHRLADILEEKQVSAVFCDEIHGEFIPVGHRRSRRIRCM
jgi:hypothetical protein